MAAEANVSPVPGAAAAALFDTRVAHGIMCFLGGFYSKINNRNHSIVANEQSNPYINSAILTSTR